MSTLRWHCLSDAEAVAHLQASLHCIPNADTMVIQHENPHLDEGGLLRWIDQAMSRSERDAAAAHLGQCAACGEMQATLRRDALTVRRALMHEASCRAQDTDVRGLQRTPATVHRGRHALRHAMRVAPWQVAATVLCVATLAASTTPLVRHLRGDAAGSGGASRAAEPAPQQPVGVPAGVVSVAPLDGRLLIVFPRASAKSSIRVERHDGVLAIFGAPQIERTPLLVLPGELRVQDLPADGADFVLRIPASVTQVRIRIGGRTMARWSGSQLTWKHGRRVPLEMPVPG